MKTTDEEILKAALQLFAERGFDGVSTSMIAEQLGITKGALYRHFESKQQIFDSIIQKMFELDAQRAEESSVPEGTFEQQPEEYRRTELSALCSFARGQFAFWTENSFACSFRRMLTLEQFRSPEMNKLHQQIICEGPVKYTEDLMRELLTAKKLNSGAAAMGPRLLALQLYAPLKLAIDLADGGADHDSLKAQLKSLTEDFENRWTIK